MPIYEYKCLNCDARVEKMQKISDAPLTVCEVCGGKLEKQWSLSGFQFKGAGWYVTDYSNKLKDTGEKSSKAETAEKTEKTEKNEKPEKSSATESTAKSEPASNKTTDTTSSSPTKTAAKKE